jgi:hypothetical protein
MPEEMAAAVVAHRQTRPFANLGEVAELGPLPPRVSMIPGNVIFTLRATARLRMSNGAYSDVVRIASATVRLPALRPIPRPLKVLRWYDDAWSQAAIPPHDGMLVTSGNSASQAVNIEGQP